MINEVEGFTLKPFMDFGVRDTKSLVYTDERNRRQARIASCTMFMLYVYDCIKADRWLQPEPQLIGFEVVGESGLKETTVSASDETGAADRSSCHCAVHRVMFVFRRQEFISKPKAIII